MVRKLIAVSICGLVALSFQWSINVPPYSMFKYELWNIEGDTTIIKNDSVGIGSRIMTDQDALVILPPGNSKLVSIDLYFTSVTTINSDSSRLYIKSLPSWSCGNNGGSHPFQSDQYTLGITNNIAVDTGWNHYPIENPIDITSDSIFIWPDLVQQINPRIAFAGGINHPSIMRMNGTLCGNSSNKGTHSTDFACALRFISEEDCPSFLTITDSDSTCYAADTIVADVLIGPNNSISYLSRYEVLLDTTFEVSEMSSLIVDMNGCPE